ncbi:MAG: hypothetical protein JXR41_06650 [Bacteroidales bacterium]|nr:hypothetical protein [Bacteroidales bacterium]MBN2762750.1 hypothetical protein [Bacteroidales bacterium]
MPPIFGILNTKLQKTDPEMIGRMKGAARYVKPRRLETFEVRGGFVAAAVVLENPLVEGKDTMSVSGPWVVVGDVSLYKREEVLGRLRDGEMKRRGEGEKGRESEGESEKQKQNGERGISDTGIVLEAWLKWGKACVKYLYGDFAFVVFNRETCEIFCGRDHMGVRPFFYCYRNGVFVFGSELRYVKASFKTKPALRHDYLLDTLVTVKTKKELSPFENVFRLKPGHYLHVTKVNLQIQQYWQFDPEKRIQLPNEEDYIALFREKLVKAVNMRCAGVTFPGSELSGGLDSSAVTGMASDFAVKNHISFTAFSNVFPENTGIDFKDEREFISEMVDFKTIKWNGVDRLDCTIPELLQYTVELQACFVQQNYSVFDRGLYEKAGEQGIQALLSGFGGDELVSARVSLPWNELIRDRQWKVIIDELYYNGITLKSLVKPGLLAARYIKSIIYYQRYNSGVFTSELLDRRFTNLPLKPDFAAINILRKRLGDNYRKFRRKKVSWQQFDRIMLDHVPQRMEYCYTAAAQYGLEYRYPLWDIDLMETCLSLPPWVKQHHGINRYIFRQAIKDFVPEMIRQRNDKSGSTIPQTRYGFVNEKDLMLDMINSCSDSTYLNEIFDFSRFQEWYEKLARRDKAELNYLNPGAFYAYLMIMLYFKDHG